MRNTLGAIAGHTTSALADDHVTGYQVPGSPLNPVAAVEAVMDLH